jgi:hypothetical protein
MKLDFSKLTARPQKNGGQRGQRGQPIIARVSVSPVCKNPVGTSGDNLTTGAKIADSVRHFSLPSPVSPECPQNQNAEKPRVYGVSPVSPVSPAFFDESEKTPADIPTLCKLLGVSWGRVEAEQILSPYDCGQIDSGIYRVVDLISYLLGAKDANYQMPFGVMNEKETVAQLEVMQLIVPSTETVNAWITKNREAMSQAGRMGAPCSNRRSTGGLI